MQWLTSLKIMFIKLFLLGNPVTVNINFKKTVEYPLDLYYVMDLSNSMSDDLQTLKVCFLHFYLYWIN